MASRPRRDLKGGGRMKASFGNCPPCFKRGAFFPPPRKPPEVGKGWISTSKQAKHAGSLAQMRKVAGSSASVEQRGHPGPVQKPQTIPQPRRPHPGPAEERPLLGWGRWDSPAMGSWISLSTGEQTPTHESFVQSKFTLCWLQLWQ